MIVDIFSSVKIKAHFTWSPLPLLVTSLITSGYLDDWMWCH